MKTEETREMLENIHKFCFICKKHMMTLCGEPTVRIGGCCCGVYYKEIKYLMHFNMHYHCFTQNKKKMKYVMTEKEFKKIMLPYFKKRLLNEKDTLKCKYCKDDWRKEVKIEIKKYQRWVNELERN